MKSGKVVHPAAAGRLILISRRARLFYIYTASVYVCVSIPTSHPTTRIFGVETVEKSFRARKQFD